MASQVQVCNLANLRLGEAPITSMTDGSKAAVAYSNNWDTILDIVLRDHPWNFATKRVQLSQLDTVPTWGYSYAYQLPGDCLRVLGLAASDDDDVDPTLIFKVEAGQLLTNETAAYIKYIYRETTMGRWDARAVSALAARLAAECAYWITGNASLKEVIIKEYRNELAGAKSIDAQEGSPQEAQTANDWEYSRY